MSPYTKNFIQTYPLVNSLRINKIFFFKILKNHLTLNIILISLILFFIIFQLILANKMAIYGFRMKELEKKKEELEVINKNLELEKIKMKSMGNTQEVLTDLNLIKTEKLEYLKPIGGTIATK